ncbi:MAG: FAD-dependent oxidoreductase [Burkholderiaceae bacterium]|nr:MAG: FAD-dependent oxidoreductase [Burkholderiaceae bacterium]
MHRSLLVGQNGCVNASGENRKRDTSVADVVVVGAGVIGITTAYYLMRKGHTVHVVDEHNEAASGCSYANGGFLSLGHVVPWSQPGIAKTMIGSLFNRQSPARWRFDGTVSQLRWLWEFYKNGTHEKFAVNKKALYDLAVYSRQCLDTLLGGHGFVSRGRTGVLQITRKIDQLPALRRQSESYRGTVVRGRVLEDRASIASIDSAFSQSPERRLYGLYVDDDYAADCCEFTRALMQYLVEQGARFTGGVRVHKVSSSAGGVSLSTDDAELQASKVVLCTGVGTESLLPGKCRSGIYPVKGYALTVPVGDGVNTPSHPIIDGDNKVAISRLGNKIRITAIAEIVGHDAFIERSRVDQMKAVYDGLFPGSVDWKSASSWIGFRPTRPSTVPVIGPLGDNVFINAGHGTYGWTLACGSASLLADLMCGHSGEISAGPYFPRSRGDLYAGSYC